VYSREPRCAEESAMYADVYFQSTRMNSESGNGHMSRTRLQRDAPNGNYGRPEGLQVTQSLCGLKPRCQIMYPLCRETADRRACSSSHGQGTPVINFRVSMAHDLTAGRRRARQTTTISAMDGELSYINLRTVTKLDFICRCVFLRQETP